MENQCILKLNKDIKMTKPERPKKVRLSLYIDEDLIKKARERCLNISAFVRKKLRKELEELEEFEKLKYKPF